MIIEGNVSLKGTNNKSNDIAKYAVVQKQQIKSNQSKHGCKY